MTAVNSSDLGRRGESAAAAHLQDLGWRVVARNVRSGRKEVDLVIRRGRVVAFVEVKTRRGDTFGHPLEAITRKKRAEIRAVAREWLRTNRVPPGTLYRFDAVAVHWPRAGRPRIVHVPDAWRWE